jgi:membrane protein DedA with SNARE-associated domain
MEEALQSLIQHGLVALFFIMLADQLALPVPMDIFLLAAGGLIGTGKLPFFPTVAVLATAGILGNSFWYYVGWRHGNRVLSFFCRISLEPDTCVRRTQNLFTRYGVRALLVAKFIPGLNTVAAPLAGVSRVGFGRFLAFNTLGLIFWIVPYLALGVLFRHQIEAVAAWGARLGTGLAWILGGLIAGYLLYKYIRRHLLIRFLRLARVTPDEVKAMMDGGVPIVVIDLRHGMAVKATPFSIPGSVHMTPEEVSRRHPEIPRDRDVVLYCA